MMPPGWVTRGFSSKKSGGGLLKKPLWPPLQLWPRTMMGERDGVEVVVVVVVVVLFVVVVVVVGTVTLVVVAVAPFSVKYSFFLALLLFLILAAVSSRSFLIEFSLLCWSKSLSWRSL